MNAHTLIPACDYDLATTLHSGQAFRWTDRGVWQEGVIGSHWVRLRDSEKGIEAETAAPQHDWAWLRHYLQTDVDIGQIVRTFPDDDPMRRAVEACRGLRLLRQDPWECLASFILSSTKQIVQIRQIVALLCERLGDPLPVRAGHEPAYSFPSAARIAKCGESELRDCKMGFRAPNLLKTAVRVARGEIQLEALYPGRGEPTHEAVVRARAELVNLPGVGNKIANCVLLFAYGYQEAFPVDVWVMKALRELYFPRRRVQLKRLERFAGTHFGPNAGYAQQYLFHYMRTK